MNKGWFPKYWRVAFRYFFSEATYSRSLRHPVKIFNLRHVAGFASRPFYAAVPSLFVLKALAQQDENTKKKNAKLIAKADALYDEAKYDDLFDLLCGESDSDDPEILWRLARAKFEKSRNANSKEKLELLEQGHEHVTRALEINDDCSPAHKWSAILLDYVWRCKSTKGRIQNSLVVKSHLQRAVEINPHDSTSYHLLGEWCYSFADLPWYQRKVAAVIFASPPTSTFEEAYSFFHKAEEMNPGFYSKNFLMLGKCLMKMKKTEEAISYLQKAYNFPIKTPDDKEARQEAEKLLRELDVYF